MPKSIEGLAKSAALGGAAALPSTTNRKPALLQHETLANFMWQGSQSTSFIDPAVKHIPTART